jgi:hypothetical protein
MSMKLAPRGYDLDRPSLTHGMRTRLTSWFWHGVSDRLMPSFFSFPTLMNDIQVGRLEDGS